METIGAKAWLVSKLLGSVSLTNLVGQRVYDESAAEDAIFPYVVISLSSANDINVMDGPVLADMAVFLVKAVTDEGRSFEQAGRIAREIHAAIHGQAGSIVDDGITYHIQGCVRTQIIQFAEYTDGKQFSHFGGLYQLMANE